MIPYDGTGCGASIYWRLVMKTLAEKNSENCPCWNTNEPLIKFVGCNDFRINIECQKKKESCIPDFNNTEKELLAKFKNFYKV